MRLKIHFIPVIPCRGYQWPVGPPTRSGIGDSLRVKPAELQSKFAAPYIAVPCERIYCLKKFSVVSMVSINDATKS